MHTINMLINKTHPEWQPILSNALHHIDDEYISKLNNQINLIPDKQNIFAAFSQPLTKMRYILLGESPYPRSISANGYAFWDNNIQSLWSKKGFSSTLNRATSLRNFFKMLLIARGDLHKDISQHAIAKLNKINYWHTATDFFVNLLQQGFLLLNASLIYEKNNINYHAKIWRPVIINILQQLATPQLNIKLIIFGRIAEKIITYINIPSVTFIHPYNLAFIKNNAVINFFQPFDLLSRRNS